MAELRPKSPVSSSLTTALPVFLQPEAERLYREVLAELNEHGVSYAVAGAVALEKYTGIWRATKDLDLFMESHNVRSEERRVGKECRYGVGSEYVRRK